MLQSFSLLSNQSTYWKNLYKNLSKYPKHNFFQKLLVACPVKEISVVGFRVGTTPVLGCTISAHTLTLRSIMISSNILIPSMSMSSKWFLSFRFPHCNVRYHPWGLQARHPNHLIFPDFITLIFDEHKSYGAFRYGILPSPMISSRSLQHLFLRHP